MDRINSAKQLLKNAVWQASGQTLSRDVLNEIDDAIDLLVEQLRSERGPQLSEAEHRAVLMHTPIGGPLNADALDSNLPHAEVARRREAFLTEFAAFPGEDSPHGN